MADDDKKFALLRIAVILMGVVLMIGTVVLFGLIGLKVADGMGGDKKPTERVVTQVAPAAKECTGGDIKLELEGPIDRVSSTGDMLTLVTASKTPNKQIVLIIDYCTKRMVSRLETTYK